MKLLRIVLSVSALLIIVCALAITAMIFLIDPNKLKPVLIQEVKNQTGYDMVIDGYFTWSFYPRIGIKAEHISLTTSQQTTPFVELNQVVFVTQLAKLFHGQQKLQGDIYISNIKLLNINIQHVHVGLHWQDQILTLKPMTANLYDGTLVGSGRINNLSTSPHWDWDILLSDIHLQPLMKAISGIDSKINVSGLGQIKLQITTQGNTRDQLLNNLNGTSAFSLKNGTVEGVDLNYLVSSANALINKQPLAIPATISQTLFDSLSGTAIIKDGIVSTNDLSLSSPALVASGAGSVNLVQEAINLQLRINPKKEVPSQWVIPVSVSGNLYRPDVRLDATELNIMIAKDKLENVKNKVRQEIKAHFSGKAGELLENMLGK